MRKNLCIAILFGLCSLALAGQIADVFDNLPPEKRGVSMKSRGKGPIALKEHEITEIGLERAGVSGGNAAHLAPVYSVAFQATGKVRYEEIQNGPLKKIGIRTGILPPQIYHRLAKFIRSKGYQSMDHNYGGTVLPGRAINYTSVIADGNRKVIRNYDDRGPDDLWAIEELIDHTLRTYVSWDAPPKALTAATTGTLTKEKP